MADPWIVESPDDRMSISTGRMVRSDGSVVNLADIMVARISPVLEEAPILHAVSTGRRLGEGSITNIADLMEGVESE